MKSDTAWALGLGAATFLLLRGRKCRGDATAVVLLAAYAGLGGYYTHTQPSWTRAAALSRATSTLSALLASLVACFVLYRISPLHPLAHFPGPLANRCTELPLVRRAFQWTRHLYLCELHERYGPVVRVAPNAVSINSRTAVHVIYSSAQCFNKSDAYDLHMKGEGVFFIKERERHAARRRPWNQALSAKTIPNYYEQLFRTTHQFVECLAEHTKEKGSIDFVRYASQWAFDSMSLITFGGSGFEGSLLANDDPTNIAEEARLTLVAFEFLGHVPWLFDILKHFPSANFRRFEIFCIEQARRRLYAEKLLFKDIFSYWLEDSEEDAPPSLDDLAVESEAAIIAATETVSSMMTIIVFLLLSHPEWHQSLLSELQAAFSDSNPLSMHCVDALDDFPVLNAVILEGLRLGSVFAGLQRVVPPGGACIDGHYLPEGTIVSVPIYAQHLDERNFGKEPTQYDPRRWMDGSPADRAALMTFGAGPFNCVGYKLAFKQLRVAVSCVFLQLDLRFNDGFHGATFWNGVRNLRATVFTEPLDVVVTYKESLGTSVHFPAVS